MYTPEREIKSRVNNETDANVQEENSARHGHNFICRS